MARSTKTLCWLSFSDDDEEEKIDYDEYLREYHSIPDTGHKLMVIHPGKPLCMVITYQRLMVIHPGKSLCMVITCHKLTVIHSGKSLCMVITCHRLTVIHPGKSLCMVITCHRLTLFHPGKSLCMVLSSYMFGCSFRVIWIIFPEKNIVYFN